MTHFDPDLIAALAEGTLDPTEAEALEREIAADPAASAELAAQRLVLTALRSAPDVGLTAGERTELRSSVADALGLVREPEAAPAAPPRRRVPWPAIAMAGASLVALVAIVPAIGLLSIGGDDDGDLAMTTVVADESLYAEAAPNSQETQVGSTQSADAVPPAASGITEDRMEQATESNDLGDDTLAGAATTMAPAPISEPLLALDLDPGLRKALEDPSILATDGAEALTVCRDEAIALLGVEVEPNLIGALVALEDGSEAVVWFVEAGDLLMEAAAFTSADCTLLYLNG